MFIWLPCSAPVQSKDGVRAADFFFFNCFLELLFFSQMKLLDY